MTNATVAGDGFAQRATKQPAKASVAAAADAAFAASWEKDNGDGNGEGSAGSDAEGTGEGAAAGVDGLSQVLAGAAVGQGGEDALLVRGARPNLTVSPKDLVDMPHLHAFYGSLGFAGGREDRGGNYVLSIEAGAGLLAAFGSA
jgi:hypothetical protein